MSDITREDLIERRDRLIDLLFKFLPDHPSRQEIVDALAMTDDILEKTETDPVNILIRQLDKMPPEARDEIIRAPDWKARWFIGAGMVGAIILAAKNQGAEDAEWQDFVGLYSKALATWLVDWLGRPEITDPYQAFISRLHADDSVRDDSIEWQKHHEDEMVPFYEMLDDGWRH